MKLIHITDTHLVAEGEQLYGLDPRARLDACIADINRHHGDADLVVITGDLTHFGDPAAFANLKDALDRLTPPYQLVVGNHDLRETLLRFFPDTPCDEAGFVQSVLDREDGRLLFLDTTLPGTHAGHYCETRLAWLGARLREAMDRPNFLFMHHPPFPTGMVPLDRISLKQADAFAAAVKPFREQIAHLFFGHVHRPICGSWLGIPFSTLRGTNHQVSFDLDAEGGIPGSHEPPAYAVALIGSEQCVVHTHDYLDQSPRFDMSDVAYGFWEEQQRRSSLEPAPALARS